MASKLAMSDSVELDDGVGEADVVEDAVGALVVSATGFSLTRL